ncbi:MAG: small, acid-soluble spore protein, alpha/beta type [Firmicutes bacterium]|mgnify:CR=1 FL=1|nr:small, acid-soluble spore protein, alpha/beta type [Bacillota bacterium]NLL89134.1 small, acid-soluble spore protein, alpha/beta type [Bacillota bacterium]HKM17636.1 small, acid-soluble spore protein, alpha/beta type [Limnochordia bacterium]
MPRRRGIMSDRLKYELAQDLGFYDKVKNGDWGNITTRDAGNMVKAAIIRAEKMLAEDNQLPQRQGG